MGIKYYIVSYGMHYNDNGTMAYHNEVTFETDGGVKIAVPVYGKFVDGKLCELVTGTNIPIIANQGIPGFGSYALESVCTNEDYRVLSYYLSICSRFKESFRAGLEIAIEECKQERKRFEEGLSHHQSSLVI